MVCIDLIDETVYQLYLRWKNQRKILETDNQEMFNNFNERGYLVEPGEEDVKVKKLLDLLEEKVNKTKTRIDPIFLLTYNCNFRCSYCYEKNIMNMGRDQLLRKMTPETVNSLFAYFYNHDISVDEIALYGGEPLLHSNEDTIRTILQRVKEKDLRIKVTTNG